MNPEAIELHKSYIKAQFNRLFLDSGDNGTIVISTGGGKTNHLNVSASQIEAIKQILLKGE